MSRKRDVEIANRVCRTFYGDLAIMDTSFSPAVTEAAHNRIMANGQTMYDYVVDKGQSNIGGFGGQIVLPSGVTRNGVRATALRVNNTRMAVCDSCAQTVIHFCLENAFQGPLEWIAIPYTRRSGHSIVVAHRLQGSDLDGSEESWGDYFIIDLWYWCLGMNTKAVIEKPAERSIYYEEDIRPYREELKQNFYSPGGENQPAARITQLRPRCCLLSTAACNALGLPDDCPELRLLRQFRDGVMADSPEDRRDVERYYAMAPAALATIEQRPDSDAVLHRLYWQAVRPAVSAIETGRHDDARAILRRLLNDPMWLGPA